MLVDVHAHLHTVEDLEKTLGEAYQAGVRKIMAVSWDTASYEKTCTIKSDLVKIYPALGIHPWNSTMGLNELEKALGKLKNARFVGEIGLDRVYSKDPKEHAAQLKIFAAFLEACKGTDKVLNIHSAGAEEQVVAMLQTYEMKHVNMHWFDAAEQGKPLKLVPKLVDLGYYFSITPGVVTSDNMRELVRMVPLENLLTETDTHPLVKYGGVPSSPKMVKTSVEGIASVKNRTVDEVENTIAQNFARLVG
jgi:TatD DNase family protein